MSGFDSVLRPGYAFKRHGCALIGAAGLWSITRLPRFSAMRRVFLLGNRDVYSRRGRWCRG